jgi:hypothetical protein
MRERGIKRTYQHHCAPKLRCVNAPLDSRESEKETAMTRELTEPLQQALDAHPDEPVSVVDPRTHETYVLIRVDEYRWLKGLLYDDSEFPIRDAYPLMDEGDRKEGWDDPDMESYNDGAPRTQPWGIGSTL